jgi:gluconolactonase
MSRWLLALPLVFCVSAAYAADPPKRSIEKLSPKLDELLASDAKVEELAEGFKWTEGPVWVAKEKKLLFSDIPNNSVFEWTDAGKIKLFLKPSGYTGTKNFGGKEPGSNALALDKEGRLLLCQHGDRRIARLAEGGKFETLADKYMGKRLNSPNDLVVLANGDIVFTDPPYGLPGQDKDPEKELDFQGVFRLKSNGELILLTKEMSRPNGLAFSPDGKTLYVANSDSAKAVWMSFPVKDDGSLGEGKVFFDVTDKAKAKLPGLPDGMKVDAKGNIFATGPGGVFIFDKDATHLGTIQTNTPTANLAWGDDGSTLYICANDRLIRIKTKTKGW